MPHATTDGTCAYTVSLRKDNGFDLWTWRPLLPGASPYRLVHWCSTEREGCSTRLSHMRILHVGTSGSGPSVPARPT